MKKITYILALVMILCVCLSACRPAGHGGDITVEPSRNTGGDTTAEPSRNTAGENQLTMPDLEIPDQHEEDYELPPGEEPDVTVIDQ